jgi:predicted ester cyclase
MVRVENKGVLYRFVQEVINHRNLARAEEFLAPTYLDHSLPGGAAAGIASWRQAANRCLSAFPDLRVELEHEVADGDQVGFRYTIHGTHKGELFGIPPTGKPVTVSGMGMVRLIDEKVVEAWQSWDLLSLLQQLGATPAPGRAKGS